MNYLSLIRNSRRQNGDTIIEILISMAILAIVLGTAFVSSSHSLQNGVDSGNRNRAIGYAQEQVEFMKSVAYRDPTAAGTYRTDKTFCVSTIDGKTAVVDGTTAFDNLCKTYRPAQNNGQFSLKINYDSTSQVSTVTVNWTGGGGNDQNEVKIYYKLPR